MTKEIELASLTRKRENHRSKITLVTKRLDGLVECKANWCVVEEEMLRLEAYLTKCQDVQEDLELLLKDGEKLQHEIESWVAFESSVMDVKAKAKQYLQQHKDTESLEAKYPAPVGPNLPRWTLPQFSGDVLQFASFWDQFEAAVDSRTDLSNVTKMVYLQSALAGEALDAIHGFTVTNANYPIVVEILRERFGRQEAVIEAHVLSLLKSDRWEKNSDGKLRELYDQLNGHIRALSVIGKDISKRELSAEDILLVLFKQRLPYQVRKRWEQKMLTDGRNCDHRLDLFFEFLRVEVEIEECTKGAPSLGRHKDSPNVNSRKASQWSMRERRDNVQPRDEKRSTAAALQAVVSINQRQLEDEKRGMTPARNATGHNGRLVTASSRRETDAPPEPQCLVCGKTHPLSLCPTFIATPVEQRWKKCKATRLRFRCLRAATAYSPPFYRSLVDQAYCARSAQCRR
ncbi:hypothetical protein M514_13548 [Trichuris suis]|uniref:Uncharacterized protein n=1 Tax=Trichuris suis TaxID=68888 RepID=A0A085MRU9_9BILA|nr:hypothetical protein M514_13548 [Trichuris suis]